MNNYFKNIFVWLRKNWKKILVIAVIHIVLLQILKIPYINILTIYFSPIVYFIDWLIILFVLKPNKNITVYISLFLFGADLLFVLTGKTQLLEASGKLIFLFLSTFLIQSLYKAKLWE